MFLYTSIKQTVELEGVGHVRDRACFFPPVAEIINTLALASGLSTIKTDEPFSISSVA